jgi:nucleoside-diphosphate-sugar epimerase
LGGLEVVVRNPTFVVGAYGTGRTSAEVVGWSPGDAADLPARWQQFASADDVAEGLVLAWPGQPVSDISGRENLTYRELLGQIADECGQPAPRVPFRPGRHAGWAGGDLL